MSFSYFKLKIAYYFESCVRCIYKLLSLCVINKKNIDMDNSEEKQIEVSLSADVAEGKYSNFVVITHSENEFVMDFMSMLPHMPQTKVQSRIIMSPIAAKRFYAAFTENMRKYDETHGNDDFSKDEPTVYFNGPQGEA